MQRSACRIHGERKLRGQEDIFWVAWDLTAVIFADADDGKNVVALDKANRDILDTAVGPEDVLSFTPVVAAESPDQVLIDDQ